MSKKTTVATIQPDPEGPLFGRNLDPADDQKAQTFAHAHVEAVTRDLLMGGSLGPIVSGFGLALTSGLGVSIAAGRVFDIEGFLYGLDDAATATLETADATNPRIDVVYASLEKDVPAASELRNFVQLRTDSELGDGVPPYTPSQINSPTELHTRAVIAVRKGTAAGSPSVPAVGANEVALFQIHVAANQTSIAGGDVTDVRRTMRSLAQALVLIDALSGLTGDLGETIDDRVFALLHAGTGIVLIYDDVTNALTISNTSTLGFTPVNKAGDSMSGALALPSNGLNVGSGQLQVAGGNLSSSGKVGGAKLESRGSVLITGEQSTDYAASFGNSNNQYRHVLRSVYNPDANVGNQVYMTLWRPGDSPDNIGSFLAFRCSSTDFQVYPDFIAGHATISTLGVSQGATVAGVLNVNSNCAITGSLTKGSGSFLIDHPLDPLNRNLIHSFVEGPRPDLIYRGRVRLQNGRAVVSIDEASKMSRGTFVALTKDAQGSAWNETEDEDNFDLVRVVRVEDGLVFIKSNNPDSAIEVGWMVVAERDDPFMSHSDVTDAEGQFIVEADKPEVSESDVNAALAHRAEKRPAEDPEQTIETTESLPEVATELMGKRGYPMHPEAIGLEAPKRWRIIVRTPRPPNPPEPEGEAVQSASSDAEN